MRINENIALTNAKTLLVPYSSHHVPTYHEWMQDADLQAATASEPLSISEEYAMQQSWRTDADKLTFIVCLPREESASESDSTGVQGGKDDRPERMIGDINLFLFEPEDEDEDADSQGPKPSSPVIGEIELMIARKDLHRQGYGRAALLSFMSYVLDSWAGIAAEYGNGAKTGRELDYLRVKINQSNERSIALFNSVGFVQTAAGANYFGEIELRWRPVRSDLEKWRGWEETSLVKYIEP
ncbi:hypothetical protein Q7P37_002611 [Cladosporium fusiforme]